MEEEERRRDERLRRGGERGEERGEERRERRVAATAKGGRSGR
jgi:hypothetical protein